MSGKERLVVGAVAFVLFVAAFGYGVQRTVVAPGREAAGERRQQTVVSEGAETVIHYLLASGRVAKTEIGRVGSDLVGKSITEVQAARPEWRIVSFARDRIVASLPCPDVLGPGGFVRAEGGFVGIFAGDPQGCHRLLEVTEVAVDSLPEAVREQLDRGVAFHDAEDLPQVLDGLQATR